MNEILSINIVHQKKLQSDLACWKFGSHPIDLTIW
jgi:hypothetical protein